MLESVEGKFSLPIFGNSFPDPCSGSYTFVSHKVGTRLWCQQLLHRLSLGSWLLHQLLHFYFSQGIVSCCNNYSHISLRALGSCFSCYNCNFHKALESCISGCSVASGRKLCLLRLLLQ